MEVQHQINEKNGIFFIEENGKQIATMSIVFAGETKFIIDHTIVKPEFEGKGLGKLLFKEMIAFAREKKYKVMPLCTYAKSVFDKTTEYNDVLF